MQIFFDRYLRIMNLVVYALGERFPVIALKEYLLLFIYQIQQNRKVRNRCFLTLVWDGQTFMNKASRTYFETSLITTNETNIYIVRSMHHYRRSGDSQSGRRNSDWYKSRKEFEYIQSCGLPRLILLVLISDDMMENHTHCKVLTTYFKNIFISTYKLKCWQRKQTSPKERLKCMLDLNSTSMSHKNRDFPFRGSFCHRIRLKFLFVFI